jgi:hypothetical protein
MRKWRVKMTQSFSEMTILYIITNILAIALPSLRISPLLIRIATIRLLYAVALSLSVIYIQSIGSGIVIFSGLFHVTLISQSIEIYFHNVGAFILMPWSLMNSLDLCLEHICSTEEIESLTWSLVSSLVPVKSKRFTRAEGDKFVLGFRGILEHMMFQDTSKSAKI